jgi:Ca2+-binding EF-hand superfamily protein
LKKAAMNVLVKHLGPTQINSLKAEFEKIDKDFSGFLEITELE